MEKELISIIVPVYNVSKYLDRCMQSLINQTYRNIEIIMIDDGSPDDCGIKCDQYAANDSRIKVIHKKNKGLGLARNSGMDVAKGKYIAFIDSDDYVEAEMIERLYFRMEAGNADTAFCRYYDTATDGKDSLAKETFQKKIYIGDEVKEVLLGMIGAECGYPGDVEIGMSVWRGLYSRDIIKENEIRFPSEREYISEDIIFHIQYLLKAKRVVVEDSPNYHYCDNGSSLTKSYKAERFKMEKKLLKKECEELDKNYTQEEYRQRLYKAFLGRVRRCIAQEVNINSEKKMSVQNIKCICRDETVQKIMDEFDSSSLNISKRLVNFFIKYKLTLALIVVFKIINKRI